MFATLPDVSRSALSIAVDDRGRALAAERVLPVPEPLVPLLPGAGLQRGSLVGISGSGGVTLLLSLLVEPLAQGSWAAAVGLPDLGLEAAAKMGVELGRLALVPDPGPGWPVVVAALLDTLDLVALCTPGHCRPAEARRLAARARERGSTLLVVGGPRWPERADVEFVAEAERWQGLGGGSGTLRRRPARVVVSGRRGGDRPRVASCWLPGPDGCLTGRRPSGEPAPASAPPAERVAWAG